MAVRRAGVTASSVVLALAVAACTSSVAEQPDASPDVTISPQRTEGSEGGGPVVTWPDGSKIETIDIDESILRDATTLTPEDVRSDESDRTDSVHPLLLALDEEGRALVELNSRDYFDPAHLEYSRTAPVAIWDDAGFTELGETDPLVPDDPHRTPIAGALVGNTALWSESYSVEGWPTEWRKFSQQFDGGEPVLLGTGHETNELQWATIHRSSAASHAVVDDRVAWNYAYEDANGMIISEVTSVPIGGGDPEPEIEQVMNVVSTDSGWLALRVGTGPTAKDVISGIDAVVFFEHGGSAREVLRIDMGDEVGAPWIIAGGNRFALWIGDDVYVGELDSQTLYRLSWPAEIRFIASEQPFCGSQFAVGVSVNPEESLTWEPFLLDLEGASAQHVESAGNAGAPLCAGGYIAWEALLDDVEERYRTVVARWE